MGRSSRREFVRNAALVAASSVFLPRVSRMARAAHTAGRPRTLVHLHLDGGFDSLWTTDPKRKRDVDSRIVVPYEENAIRRVGDVTLGPLFRELSEHVPRMAIVNGVIGATVSHLTGRRQVHQMRRVFPARNFVGMTGIIGALRGGDSPLHDVRFYENLPVTAAGPHALVSLYGTLDDPTQGIFFLLSKLARKKAAREDVVRALGNELTRCHDGSDCSPVEVVQSLLRRMGDTPLPDASPLLGEDEPARLQYAAVWRDVFFLLTNRLAGSIFMVPPGSDWDSHILNDSRQAENAGRFAPQLSYFIRELGRRRTIDGALLADEVGIVISSELGRFPVLNSHSGKDHFPEFPVILIGPGIRPGQYGQTDGRMIATPISRSTGHGDAGAKGVIPTLDDIGATVLNWFGLDDAASLGYLGDRLDFLLA